MNILEKILNGEKITKEINIEGRGKFVIAFPLPSDLRRIEIRLSKMMSGQPLESFDSITIANFRCYATLEEMLISAPEWFENLSSIEECPDEELLTQLYRGYLQLYKETQKSIGKSKLGRKDKKIKVEDEDEAVGDGAFSDIAHGSENKGAK